MSQIYEALPLLKEQPFTAADRMFVSYLREDSGESNSWLLLAAALCSLSAREGHAYFDLANPRGVNVKLPQPWPSVSQWKTLLLESPIARSESETRVAPLVLASESALYLEKYFAFEQRLATLIRARCSTSSGTPSSDPAVRAAGRKFFVITGGPGTGKTTLALRYLNTLLDNWKSPRPPRFAAIAPTGKAAARLAESIATGVNQLSLDTERETALLAIPCLTIHRLLGSLPHRSSFRKDAKNPLRYDTLVIDESSMIDLPLMMRLFEALSDDCQVLLLGDKDQLASVDVGSVLGDILEASESESSPMRNSVERLTKTYRFSEDSGIYRACQLAREGDQDGFVTMLENAGSDFDLRSLNSDAKRIPRSAIEHSFKRHQALASCKNAAEALTLLNESMTLTPTRRGPFGSVEYNRQVDMRIRQALDLDLYSVQPIHGAPIIVLENDYELELYNGDLGLVWIEPSTGVAQACFSGSKGEERRFRLSELPRYETAFALTIHKSQGSEFTETLCLFGPEIDRAVTRELVYTAFSRAKRKLIVYADPQTLGFAIGRQAVRATRLSELLRK